MPRRLSGAGVLCWSMVLWLGASIFPAWSADAPPPAAAKPAATAPAAANPAATNPAAASPAGATPAASPATPMTPEEIAKAEAESLAQRQEVLARRYQRFEETLRKVSESLKRGDRDRADLLTRALGKSHEDRIHKQMTDLVEVLKQQQKKDAAATELAQLGEAFDRQGELILQLQGLLELLQSEDRAKELREERERIEKYLKDLNRIIAQEKDVRAATERGENAQDLAARQKALADKAAKLGNEIDKDDAAKAAKAKAGEQDGKPSDGKPGEGKPGDEKKPGDGKPQDGKPQDGKPGSDKEGKPGEDKEGKPSDGKPSDGKPSDGKPSDGKPSDGKPSDGKPSDGKPSDGKPSDGKPSDGKPSDGKPSDGKPSDGKPSDGKPSDGKPSDGKPSDGKPSDGKPSDGKPSDGKPSDGKPSDGKPSDGKPSDGKQGEKKSTPGRENLEQAKREMENAIDKLKKQSHNDASDHQDEALRELAKAKEKLEEILRQLREEERERLLQALEGRFRRMLEMQVAVYNDTVKLSKRPVDERDRARQLALQEREIADEAYKAIALLQDEGTAVAFPEAVQQMREDMLLVGRRLEGHDVGNLTQAIEKDIIDALKEIIEALQKEMEKKDKKQPPSDGPPKDGKEPDPSLVDQLAELKMLRSLQLRVNHRTKRLGEQVEGEQALEVDVVEQLRNLSDRQARIQQATHNIVTGRNK